MENKYKKGSEWRKWDLHIHTPLSYLNNGFGNNFDDYVKKLFKKAIKNKIYVIGITDYFCIEGYKKIKQDYLEKPEKMKELFNNDEIEKIKKILVLPNIEFRLNKLIQEENRVNYHVIFSNKVSITDIEENFLHELEFVYEGNPSSSDEKRKLKLKNIEELGKKLKKEHSSFSSDTNLFVGMKCAVVDDNDISKILDNKKSKFKGNYLIFTPADEDLSDISWDGQNHNIRKVLIQKSHGLFTSNSNTIRWALGKLNKVEDYIKEFKSLKPCIWGSDAHNFDKLFNPDNNRFTWIKADPTFEGLKQIIYEPEERVFIGENLEFLDRVKNNKTKYIKTLKIDQVDGYDEKKGVWFKNQEIELNKELVAIIGNKGNGKSAIADILGFLGNSYKYDKFSFLESERFLKGGLAKNFKGTLIWEDGTKVNKNLGTDKISKSEVEKVRYLPQNFFNDLTNELETKDFTKTLENVIFSHLDDSKKLGKSSFSELKEYKSKIINKNIEQIKIKIKELNKNIVQLEKYKQSEYLEEINNKILEKENEIKVQEDLLEELKKNEIKNPNIDEKSGEKKQKKFEEIEKINKKIEELEKDIEEAKNKKSQLEINKQDLINFLAYFKSFEKQILDYKEENKEKYKKLGLDIDKIIVLDIKKYKVEEKLNKVKKEITEIEYLLHEKLSLDFEQNKEIKKQIEAKSLIIKKDNLLEKIKNIKKDLSKQETDYQNYIQEIKKIEEKIKEIKGNKDKKDSLEYYKNIKKYLSDEDKDGKTKLIKELDNLKEKRLKLSLEIYGYKNEIIKLYKELKDPIDKKVEENKEYLENQINIDVRFLIKQNFNKEFLNFINQSKRGSFNGKIEGEQMLKDIYQFKDLNKKDNIKEILNNFIKYINFDKREGEKNEKRDIFEQINNLEGFYDYVFGLDYIDTEFELKSGEKSLKELSPGEKGILLLIFYLMIDEEGIPLIIDQPEDNLDNQSVFEMLSTFIKKAKKKRQIIIVTHNPNLAVGADAEQVIFTKIDKEKNNTFSFESGSIENKKINNYIVDILEGTMSAFNKRELKYIK